MKVKDHPQVTGRWLEYNIALIEDWEVLWADGQDDYQGSCSFVAWVDQSWNPQFVMVDWSWGSCSGCDGYEDMAEKERILAFMNQRSYFNETSLAAWLKNYEDANLGTLSKLYLGSPPDWDGNILLKVNAIRHALEMPAWMP